MTDELKLKKLLQEFLKQKGITVSLDEIQSTNSWHSGEFQVRKRYYHVESLKQWNYGSDFYEYHEYEDIKGYRVSIGYYMIGLHSEVRSIHVGCEKIYTFKKRTANYKKMSEARMDNLVESYVKEYITAGCPGDANIETLRKTIKYELSKAFLKKWYDK